MFISSDFLFFNQRMITDNRQKEISYKVNKDGCWNCISHAPTGLYPWCYPAFKRNGKRLKISHYMFEKFKGEIPTNKILRHTCNNSMCINPDHLILGTHKDNMEDMVKSGHSLKGENHHNSKLTLQKIKEIIQNKISTTKELAQKYNISGRQIRYIKAGKRWKDISC